MPKTSPPMSKPDSQAKPQPGTQTTIVDGTFSGSTTMADTTSSGATTISDLTVRDAHLRHTSDVGTGFLLTTSTDATGRVTTVRMECVDSSSSAKNICDRTYSSVVRLLYPVYDPNSSVEAKRASNCSSALQHPAPIMKPFYDEEYGMTYTPSSKHIPPPNSTAVATSIELLHSVPDYSHVVPCLHRDWEECNIIRRYSINNLPVYVYDLPTVHYDKTTNTVTLHGEAVQAVSYLTIPKGGKYRIRTWAGKSKKRSNITIDRPLSWFSNPTYDWSPLETLTNVNLTREQTYPLETTNILGPNSPICFDPTIGNNLVCLAIDSSADAIYLCRTILLFAFGYFATMFYHTYKANRGSVYEFVRFLFVVPYTALSRFMLQAFFFILCIVWRIENRILEWWYPPEQTTRQEEFVDLVSNNDPVPPVDYYHGIYPVYDDYDYVRGLVGPNHPTLVLVFIDEARTRIAILPRSHCHSPQYRDAHVELHSGTDHDMPPLVDESDDDSDDENDAPTQPKLDPKWCTARDLARRFGLPTDVVNTLHEQYESPSKCITALNTQFDWKAVTPPLDETLSDDDLDNFLMYKSLQQCLGLTNDEIDWAIKKYVTYAKVCEHFFKERRARQEAQLLQLAKQRTATKFLPKKRVVGTVDSAHIKEVVSELNTKPISYLSYVYTFIQVHSILGWAYLRYAFTQTWFAITAWYYARLFGQEIHRWKQALINFVSGPMSDKDTIKLVEIHSIVRIIYHIYNGSRDRAIEAASTFSITKRDFFLSLLSLSFDSVKEWVTKPSAKVVIDGVERDVSPAGWESILGAYEANPHNPDYSGLIMDVEVHSGNPLLTLWNYAFPQDLSFLSPDKLREANNQFTYLRHKQLRFDSAYDSGCVILSMIGRTFFGVDPFDPEYITFVSDMTSIVEYTRHATLQAAFLYTNRAFAFQVREKFDEASQIAINPRVNTAPKFLQTSFRRSLDELENLSRTASAQIHGSGKRMEPLSVILTGPPSGGKSKLVEWFIATVAELEGVEADPQQMYTREAGNEYWDTYNKQRFVLVDDLWKVKDIPTRALQCAEIISMINSAPFNLNIAKCEGKGTTFFDSEYVFFSTNACNNGLFKDELQVGATDPNAVKRRFHVAIHQPKKLETDLWEAKWRVDACPLPEYVYSDVNKVMLTTAEVYRMLYAVRQFKIQQEERWNYTKTQIREKMGLDVQVHADTPPTITSLFIRLHNLGLYDWSFSQYRTHFIVLFSLLVLAGVGSGVYKHFFSTTPHYGEPDFAIEPGVVYENGKWVKWQETEEEIAERIAQKYEREQVSGTTLKGQLRARHKHLSGVQTHSAEMNCATSMINNLSKSMVFFGCECFDPAENKTVYRTCVGTHLQAGWVLTCAHWFNYFRDLVKDGQKAKFFVRTQTGEYHMDFPTIDSYITAGRTDAVCILMPPAIPPMKSTLNYVNRAQHAHSLREGTKLQMLRVDSTLHPIYRKVTVSPDNEPITYPSNRSRFWVERPITYFDMTKQGESGSLLIAEAPQGRPVIVGMHTGFQTRYTSNHVSFAVPLLQEVLMDFIGLLPPQEVVTEVHNDTEGFYPPNAPGFPIRVVRIVDPSEAVYLAPDSKIKKSAIHGWSGPAKSIPARLKTFVNKAGETVNPLYKALSKVVQTPFEGFDIPDSVYSYVQNLYPRPFQPPRVLTLDESLNGIPERGIPAIRLDTSPGYPYILKKGRSQGKHSFVTRDSPNSPIYFKEGVREQMEDYHETVKSGKNVSVIWADNLKDETRPADKVMQGKTRLISSCPLHMLLLTRMYFAEFVSYVQQTPAERPVAVGLNVHSSDWSRLYGRLSRTNGSVISGDFTNFDGSIPSFLNVAFVNFVNWWYDDGEANASIRQIIMSNTTNALHIVSNYMYQAAGGEPSGEPITSIKNSFINLIATFYILNVVLKIPSTQIQLTIYGDDIIICLAQHGLTWKDLAPYYLKYFGMTFTHCSKKENEGADTLDTVTYLSRMFVAGKFAPLPIDTIVECTYWRRGEQFADEILVSTAECFFLELSHHPERIFNSLSRKLLEAIEKCPKARHLLGVVQSKQRSYHYYQERKYNPSTSEDPFEVYYDTGRWKYRHLDGFECTSGNGSDVLPFTPPSTMDDRTSYAPMTTQRTELTTYRDVDPMDPGVREKMSAVHAQINLEGFSMDQTLSRTYHLQTLTWTTSMARETVIGTYLFPDELFTQNYISDKILGYTFFTADILMTFRVISNNFLYGNVMVDFVPLPNNTTFQPNTIQKCSGSKSITISATESQVVSYTIPFISFQRVLEIDTYTVGDMGRIRVRVNHPLSDINGEVTSCEIMVTARFVNPQLRLPTNQFTSPALRLDYKDNKKKYVDAHELAYTDLSDFVVTSGVGEPDVDLFVPPCPIVGPKRAANSHTTRTIMNPSASMSYGQGVDSSLKLTMDPFNAISDKPCVAGIRDDEMQLLKIVMKPALTSYTEFTSNTDPVQLAVASPDVATTSFTYVDWVSRFFRSFSGSIKVKLYISASNYHKVRMVFYLSQSATNSTDWESTYSTVLDISGDTELALTLPYMGAGVVQSTNIAHMYLYGKVLSWNTPDNVVAPPIRIDVYKAAARDFRLYGYYEAAVTVTHNMEADFESDFPFLHASMKYYYTDGYVFGEQYDSLYQVISRPHAVGLAPASGTFASFSGVAPGTIHGLGVWSLLYYFWRGSVRWKHVVQDARFGISVCFQQNLNNRTYCGYYQSCPSSPILEYTVPYYTNRIISCTGVTSDTFIFVGNSTVRPNWRFNSAGHDFSFSYLKLPPAGTVVYTPPNGNFNAVNWNNFLDPRVAVPPPV